MTSNKTNRKAQVKSIQRHPLKLTQDIVFKSFFSRNKQVLLSLLKSFLPICEEISDVKILNLEKTDRKSKNSVFRNSIELKESYIVPKSPIKKQIALDLRVQLKSGENINVEMQAVSDKYLLKRILFYWAKLYSQGLERGESYDKVNPAYSIVFTNFSVLDGVTDFESSYSIRRDKEPYELFNEDLKIVIVEMNKLRKSYTELLDLKEKWCYVLREAGGITREEFQYLSRDEEIEVALKHLEKLSRDNELYQQALTEELNLVAYRLDKAGWIEEGMQKGRVQGKLEGEFNKQKQIALNMLKEGFKMDLVSKVTDLSEKEISVLKK